MDDGGWGVLLNLPDYPWNDCPPWDAISVPPGITLCKEFRKDLSVDRHPQRRVHTEFFERQDFFVGGDAAHGGDRKFGDSAQAAEPI